MSVEVKPKPPGDPCTTPYYQRGYYNAPRKHLDVVLIPNTPSSHDAVNKMYKDWYQILQQICTFAEQQDGAPLSITMEVCETEKNEPKCCYSIKCLSGGQILKEVVDNYKEGMPVPSIRFAVTGKRDGRDSISPESYPRVNVKGANPPNDHFLVDLPMPVATGAGEEGSKSEEDKPKPPESECKSPSWNWRAKLITILTNIVLPVVVFPCANIVLRYFGMYSHPSEQYYALYVMSGAVTVLLGRLVRCLYEHEAVQTYCARYKICGLILFYFCIMVVTQFLILQYLCLVLLILGIDKFPMHFALLAFYLFIKLVRWFDEDFEETYKQFMEFFDTYFKWRLILPQ